MSSQTTSIKVFIDDREAGKSLKELRQRYQELKKEILDGSATGKSLNQLNSEFQKVARNITEAENELKKFNAAGENKFTLTEQIKQLKKELKGAGDNMQLASEKMKLLAEAEAKMKRIDGIISGDRKSAKGQSISDVRKEITLLNRAIETQLIPGTKEYDAALQRLAKGKQILQEHSQKIREIESSMKQTAQSGSFNELKSKYDQLEKEIDDLTMGTEEYREKIKQLQAMDKQIDQHERKVKGIGKTWEFVKSELKSFGMIALSAVGIGVITNQISNLISKSAELSDVMADVQRTTNLSASEVKDLYDEFKGFNTRTARLELMELAKAAGKMGITGKENVKNFVEEANKINVALGSDLGQDAVTKIAKISEVFKIAEQEGIMLGDAMTKVGNTINQLGQSSTAQESYITDFIFRLGGIATQADISVDQIAALGATMDQLGLSAEVSSTALSQIITDMSVNYAQYADIAGMAAEEFNKLLKEDAMEAFTVFLEGLNNSSDGLGMMGAKLQDLSIDGVRGISVITSLAKNTKLLRESVKIANDEYSRGNSMLEEYNKRNENFAGSLERLSRWIGEKFLNSGFIKSIQDGVIWMDKMTRVTDAQSKALEKQQLELLSLQAELYRTNTPQKDRVKIINELKNLYPKHLENINAETATNEQLRTALKAVNDEMINKIILAKEDERITRQNEKQATAQLKMFASETQAINEMNRLKLKFNVEIPEGKDVIDQVQKFYANFRNATLKVGKSTGGVFDPLYKFDRIIQDLKFNTSQYNNEIKNTNALLEGKEALINRLGITVTDDKTSGETTGKTETEAERLARIEAERLKKMEEDRLNSLEKTKKDYADFGENISNIRRQLLLDSLSANQRELEEIYDRYQNEIATVQKAKSEVLKAEDLTAAQKLEKVKVYNANIIELEELMGLEYRMTLEKQAKSRLEAFQKTMEEENKVRKDAQDKLMEGYQEFENEMSELGLTEKEKKIKQSEAFFLKLEEQAIDYYENYLKLTGVKEEELTKLLEKIRAERDKASSAIASADINEDPFKVDADFAALGAKGQIAIREFKKIKEELIKVFGPEEGEKLFNEFFQPFLDRRMEFIEAITGMVSTFSEGIISLFQVMGAEGERFAAFQKALSFFMIIADTASAVSAAIVAAFKTPSVTVFEKIAYMVGAVSAVISGMAKAKAMLSSSEMPSYNEGGDTGPGFYTDKTGEKVAGVVHAEEYVIPRWMRKIPKVANTVAILESIRTNKRYESGGNVSTNALSERAYKHSNDTMPVQSIQLYDPEMKKILKKLADKGVSISWDKLEKTTNRIKSIDKDA